MPQKLPMADVIVIAPGIFGSVLALDNEEIWGVRASSLLDNLLSLGGNLNRLRLPVGIGHDDPGDGVAATRLMPGLHFLPHFWKVRRVWQADHVHRTPI
jgi:hypothetical protein